MVNNKYLRTVLFDSSFSHSHCFEPFEDKDFAVCKCQAEIMGLILLS